MTLFSAASASSKDISVIHSMGYKAYLRPGISEGFAGVRSQKILTLSDVQKARNLPKHNWPQKVVYQTPASHRVMLMISLRDSEGFEKLKNASDSHFAVKRPKSIIGSSRTIWESELDGTVINLHLK